jgi:adenine/guanine phosphoribosyltransferase-like PRPP-binding protein
MKYTVDIDHELKIIRYAHSGIIQAEEIAYVWGNEFLKMKEFTELKYDLYSDYSNAKFDIPVEFLPELMEFMESIKPIIKGKKQSIIVDDPYSTAASLLFENEANKEIGFLVKVFNTKNAALEWLIK